MAQAEVEGGPEHGDDIDFTFDGGAEQIDMEDFDFELDGGDVLQEGTVPGDQEVGEDFVAGQNEVGEVDEIGYEDIIGTNSQQLTENEGSNTISAQDGDTTAGQGTSVEDIDYAGEDQMDNSNPTHENAQDRNPGSMEFEAPTNDYDAVLENPSGSIEANLVGLTPVDDMEVVTMPETAAETFELLPVEADPDTDGVVIDDLDNLDGLEHSFDGGEGMGIPNGSAGLDFEEDATGTENSHVYHDEDEMGSKVLNTLGKYATQVPIITVTWGDDSCSLFKLPGLEDPESFYLEDVSLINEPLSTLLSGMRRSISSYVPEEQEIYIKMTELGLEFGETTTPALLDTVTLHSLLALHENLAKNDDPTAEPSVHFELTTKLNCTLRVPQLVNAAKEGKGLSAFQPLQSATHVSDGSADNDTGSYDVTPEGDDSGVAGQDDQEDDYHEEPYEGEGNETREQFNADGSKQLDDGNVEDELHVDGSPEDEDDEDLIDYEDHEGDDAGAEAGAGYPADAGKDADVDAAELSPDAEQHEAHLETAHLGEYVTDEPSHEIGAEEVYGEGQENAVNFETTVYEDIDYNEDHPQPADTIHTEFDGQEYAGTNISSHDAMSTASRAADEPKSPGSAINPSVDEQAALKADYNDDEYLDLGESGANETGLDLQTDAAGPPGLSSQPTSASNTLNGDEVDYQNRQVAHPPSAANDNAVTNAETDFDEIDWEDNDKIVPPTQSGSIPTSMTGKRTRETGEPEEVLGDGHDAKRPRP